VVAPRTTKRLKTLAPERWAQIEKLFHRAAECDVEQRAALLDEACRTDAELRREVEELLSSDRTSGDDFQSAVRSELGVFDFPLVGETVSHYCILEGLGGGGMGLVYRAEDITLGRQVAIKFLPEESATDPATLARFQREARSASALEHPNICPIYEFGEHDGRPFLVMQLLEGQTLRELIGAPATEQTALPLNQLLDVAIQILDGLEAAHKKGIVHRDIKPANIFVTEQGQAKILDFGLAKLTQSTAEDESESSETRRTRSEAPPDLFLSRTGVAMGTAGYMSPEQVRGEKLDGRTDLFSFGLVLYEMATRQRAFAGDTAPVLHHAILNQTPAPARDLNSQIPAKLETIINTAIQKDRTLRYQTTSAIRDDLEDLQRQLAPKRLPRGWFLGLGTAAAIFVAIFLLLLMKKPKTVSVVPEIRMRQLTTNSSENPVIGGAISPDGKYLAYSDTRGLHIKVINTGETRTVAQPGELKGQSVKWEVGPWFPDSTRFLVDIHPSRIEEEWSEWSSVNTSIWTVSMLGGPPTKLRDHAVAWGVSLDGSLVSFGTNKGKFGEREVWLMHPNGEQAQKVQETSDNSAICCLIWSPDGKRYMYILTNSSGDTALSRGVKGGPPVTILQSSELKKLHDLLWLHDGRLIYDLPESGNEGVCNYWIMRLDVATGKHVEEPRRLTNWPSFCVSSGSVTTDDKRLAFAGWTGFDTTYLGDLEAGGTRLRNLRHFTLQDSNNGVYGWTSRGKAIIAQNHAPTWSMYMQSLDSDTQEPVVSGVTGGALLLGATTPDDKWYIGRFWPDGETLPQLSVPLPILRIPLTGGTPQTVMQLSHHAKVSCARPSSSTCVIAEQTEDRKQMVVSIFDPIRGRGPELARFDFDRELDPAELPVCAISPDGARLAIARSPESPIEIRSLRGQLIHTIPLRSLGTLIGFEWAMNQKGFFVTRRAPRGNELLHLDLEGKATSLRQCYTSESCYALPSPDGRYLAIIDSSQSKNIWMIENF
jgi:serine/threonine protein kinase